MQHQITQFCSDPKLVELIEVAKSNSDVLDLVTPRENQHSDLLAWCLNPREGHGQADALLKDFLLAIHVASTNEEPGDRLFGRGLTRDFVRRWSPARILVTSFASAMCFREYALPESAGDAAGGRIDLLVIDMANRLMVVVENKAGAKFGPNQLHGYLEGIKSSLLAKAAFRDFNVAFVAMDRDSAPEDQEEVSDDMDPRWAKLNYDWLRPGAKRAEFSVSRGNQEAAVLLSYCRRQTGYESDQAKLLTNLAREIAISHPGVVAKLRAIISQCALPHTWTPQLLDASGPDSQLLALYLQHRDAMDSLIHMSPLQLLHARIVESHPEIASLEESHEYGRVWMNYRQPFGGHLPTRDDYWPLYIRVRQINGRRQDGQRIRVALVWLPINIPDEHRSRLCHALGQVYPEATKSEKRIRELRLEVLEVANPKEALVAIERLQANVKRALAGSLESH